MTPAQRWREENKEYLRKQNRLWRKKNRKRLLAYLKTYRRENALALHHKFIAKKFGLTPEQYEALLASRNGCCDICGEKERQARRTRLCVDHCHQTGKIRGLLCNQCNQALGGFCDNVILLRAAIDYLYRPKEKI